MFDFRKRMRICPKPGLLRVFANAIADWWTLSRAHVYGRVGYVIEDINACHRREGLLLYGSKSMSCPSLSSAISRSASAATGARKSTSRTLNNFSRVARRGLRVRPPSRFPICIAETPDLAARSARDITRRSRSALSQSPNRLVDAAICDLASIQPPPIPRVAINGWLSRDRIVTPDPRAVRLATGLGQWPGAGPFPQPCCETNRLRIERDDAVARQPSVNRHPWNWRRLNGGQIADGGIN